MNGLEWRPIEEGLPPMGMCLIVTIRDTFHQRLELRYPVEYRESWYGESCGFYELPSGYQLMPDCTPVTAWMPLPEPYAGGAE